MSATLDFRVERSQHAAAAAQHRVVLVTNSYDRNIDGVALTLNRLVAHLLTRGHEVLVIVPTAGRRRPALRAASSERLVRVPSIPLPIWSEYRLTWGLGREARAQLEAFNPTVMHIAIQDAMGHAAQRWAVRRGVPVVCSHHTRFERYLGYYGLQVLQPLFWFGMRRFHRSCAATLPPSASLAGVLSAHGVPRVGVWPRGVDRSLYTPTARSAAWRGLVNSSSSGGSFGSPFSIGRLIGGGGGADTPIVLLVARLRWEKGLAAFAAVVNDLHARGESFRVAIVGDGPAREGLRARLPAWASFFGTLTGAALAEAYASSDVFLFPSTSEGWGATCLEAQAAGVPVVATRSSGIVEVVQHGVGGMLLPPNNITALADAVAELVRDASLRRAMGRRAEQHAAKFEWSRSGDRMLCEYVRHAGPGAAPPADAVRPSPAISERLATAAGYPPYLPCPASVLT